MRKKRLLIGVGILAVMICMISVAFAAKSYTVYNLYNSGRTICLYSRLQHTGNKCYFYSDVFGSATKNLDRASAVNQGIYIKYGIVNSCNFWGNEVVKEGKDCKTKKTTVYIFTKKYETDNEFLQKGGTLSLWDSDYSYIKMYMYNTLYKTIYSYVGDLPHE
ncbi:MAG: hypothetical protein J5649_10160 [Lachnospiraceae bacterium]|nr:hypothetical protein [Lachnospiraceae bacterium]